MNKRVYSFVAFVTFLDDLFIVLVSVVYSNYVNVCKQTFD